MSTVIRVPHAGSVILTAGQVLGQTGVIFAPPWTARCRLSSALTRGLSTRLLPPGSLGEDEGTEALRSSPTGPGSHDSDGANWGAEA